MPKTKKNIGKKRYEIALERIHYRSLRAMGNSFLWSEMNELVMYALTGKLSRKDPTWEPRKEDLHEIDYGKPMGLDFIDKEFEKEWNGMYGIGNYGY